MQDSRPSPGISGMALAVPPARVDLGQWCQWTGADAGKIRAVVGHGFRICDPQRDAYSLAASAVLRLIEDYDIDPSRVGWLALGTESSTDNAAGAVIVRGLVDAALVARGRPPLARACEVPEFKHACLGGVYAIKGAMRYLASDGQDRQAIVVCSDLAEYARGSSGEPTQGAGAVALLLEPEARMLSLDLAAGGSSSAYRRSDFRKPFSRFAGQLNGEDGRQRLADFPLFNGRYSTSCYVDAVLAAGRDLLSRRPAGQPAAAVLEDFASVFMHRPYHHMPRAGWEAMQLLATALDAAAGQLDAREQLQDWCRAAEIDSEALIAELLDEPNLLALFDEGDAEANGYPLCSQAARALRKHAAYPALVAGRLQCGSKPMMELGNLYTAALPAWLAFGLAEAAREQSLSDHDALLLVGYGSGDAAELLPGRLVPGWREMAARMQLEAAMAVSHDLDQQQYQDLHDGLAWNPGNGSDKPASGNTLPEIVLERVGQRQQQEPLDAGIGYYGLSRQ